MIKQEIQFAVVIKDGEVKRIGRSYIEHLEIQYDGRKTKWFDESQILMVQK